MRAHVLGFALGTLLFAALVEGTASADSAALPSADPALVRVRELLTPVSTTLELPGSPRFAALCDPAERGTRVVVGWLVRGVAPERTREAAALADALGRDGQGSLAAALPAVGRVTSTVAIEDLGFAGLLLVTVGSTRRGVAKELELGVLQAVARLGEEPTAPAAALARRALRPLTRAVVEVHPPEPPQKPVRLSKPASHVIERGDTLSEIAAQHGLDLETLVRLNGVDPKKPIHPGDELKLDAGEPRPKLYVAQPGDTLAKVAKRFGVSEKALLEANRIEERRLRPGQKLVLPR